MSARKKRTGLPVKAPRARHAHSRQRQRLIDACISALHLYGPSRTTVEKVVAIAKMSPGIVRFYFDSKAAMLVASLQFLAAEFEEQVLVPVSKLKSRPVAALELLVDLYLDPDIASPRKVSVWYAFWGEASSRQEYYDICGQKDESFAVLVRELIGRLIDETSQPQLDPGGIALGLIGALEMLWQDFAFQSELNIDRQAAKRRCMAYLRSIFPGQFSPLPTRSGEQRHAAADRFAAWVYGSARAFALERDGLLRSAWQMAGHEALIPQTGDFMTVDTGADRALLVRDSSGNVHALRNSCPEQPHALVSEAGRFRGDIECKVHGLKFGFDGRRADGAPADLGVLDLQVIGGLLIVRSSKSMQGASLNPHGWFDGNPSPGLRPLGPPTERAVAADWKVLVEQWLESASEVAQNAAVESVEWTIPSAESGSDWSSQRYRGLAGTAAKGVWKRRFIAPNQLLESRPDGLSILQAIPTAPGRCRLRRLDFTLCTSMRAALAMHYLATRRSPLARRSVLAVAESLQKGLIDFGYQAAPDCPIAPAVAWFRRRLMARIPALALDRPPSEL